LCSLCLCGSNSNLFGLSRTDVKLDLVSVEK